MPFCLPSSSLSGSTAAMFSHSGLSEDTDLFIKVKPMDSQASAKISPGLSCQCDRFEQILAWGLTLSSSQLAERESAAVNQDLLPWVFGVSYMNTIYTWKYFHLFVLLHECSHAKKKGCTSLLIFDWLILTVDICGQISRNVGLCGRCSLPLPLCAIYPSADWPLLLLLLTRLNGWKQIWCNLAKMRAMLSCLNTLGFNSMILSCSLHLKDDDILN